MVKKILLSEEGRKFYLRNEKADFHTQFGFIRKDVLKKAKSGTTVKTNTGSKLTVIEASFIDNYEKIKRLPQIIPRKDIATIIATTGIGKGSIVVDAGTGSGALSLFLANMTKKVTTYEIREDFAKIAEENIKELKLKNISIKQKSIYKGIDEKEVDLVCLDLPEPWEAIEPSTKALKPGGFIVSYSPTIPQVSDFIEAVKKNKSLIHIKTTETIEREWDFKDRVIRPKSQPIGHSGFLTFIRKIK
jgi:tRNA (adenine57-N1/adenine58-N1)-methyltransferase catalytic subunit